MFIIEQEDLLKKTEDILKKFQFLEIPIQEGEWLTYTTYEEHSDVCPKTKPKTGPSFRIRFDESRQLFSITIDEGDESRTHKFHDLELNLKKDIISALKDLNFSGLNFSSQVVLYTTEGYTVLGECLYTKKSEKATYEASFDDNKKLYKAVIKLKDSKIVGSTSEIKFDRADIECKLFEATIDILENNSAGIFSNFPMEVIDTSWGYEVKLKEPLDNENILKVTFTQDIEPKWALITTENGPINIDFTKE